MNIQIETPSQINYYVGMARITFKMRLAYHNPSFSKEKNSVSNYNWQLKEAGVNQTIKSNTLIDIFRIKTQKQRLIQISQI